MRDRQKIRQGWRRWLTAVSLIGVACCFNAVSSGQEEREFRPKRVIKALPPITEFPVKSASEAGDLVQPNELVLGVTVGKESRAYPINMLTGPRREILNDTLGGHSIAATW